MILCSNLDGSKLSINKLPLRFFVNGEWLCCGGDGWELMIVRLENFLRREWIVSNPGTVKVWIERGHLITMWNEPSPNAPAPPKDSFNYEMLAWGQVSNGSALLPMEITSNN